MRKITIVVNIDDNDYQTESIAEDDLKAELEDAVRVALVDDCGVVKKHVDPDIRIDIDWRKP